jgi:hypothetical protein
MRGRPSAVGPCRSRNRDTATRTPAEPGISTDSKVIGEVDKRCTLLSTSSTAAGYRSYSDADRARLLFIRRCRTLGFSLDDVRELLSLADREEAACAAVDAKVEDQLA